MVQLTHSSRRRRHCGRIAVVTLLLLAVLTSSTVLALPAEAAASYDFSLLELCLNYISRYYTGTYDVSKLIEGAASGLVAALGDQYSQYLTADQYAALMSGLEGHFGGLGIYIDVAPDGYILIIAPIKGTPADLAGLRAGDKIVSIDGTDIRGYDINVAQRMLRGDAGTKVRLGIVRSGVSQVIEVELTRAIIVIDPVEFALLEGSVGYIALTSFSENSTRRVDEAIEELKQLGARVMVLDLRNNGGGLLNQAISLAERFLLPGQRILSVQYNSGEPQVYNTGGGRYVDLPVVVLVNQGTASAAEILAGAIKDNGCGLIVGTQTYGKGAIQNVWQITNGGGLRLTTAHYFTPSGEALDGKGITPQYVVEPSANDADAPYLDWYRPIRHMRVGLDALALEQVLMFLGLTREADGVYGLSSVNAVKLFQKDSGILQTGVVNEETALLLNRAVQAAVAGTTDRQLDKALELLGVTR